MHGKREEGGVHVINNTGTPRCPTLNVTLIHAPRVLFRHVLSISRSKCQRDDLQAET